MIKKSILLTFILAMAFSLSTTNLMAKGNNAASGKDQPKKNSPFLITGQLPHLTKMLMKQWDNQVLNLTEEQKSELLVVRKETIAGVQELGRKIAPLEKQVVEGIFAGKTADELHSSVQTIAGLKTEATMIHLRCIYNTNEILDQKQRDFLKGPSKKSGNFSKNK